MLFTFSDRRERERGRERTKRINTQNMLEKNNMAETQA
jgi:hypothetical protein